MFTIINSLNGSITYESDNNGIHMDGTILPFEVEHCANNHVMRLTGEVHEIVRESIELNRPLSSGGRLNGGKSSSTQLNISTTMHFVMRLKEKTCLLFEVYLFFRKLLLQKKF